MDNSLLYENQHDNEEKSGYCTKMTDSLGHPIPNDAHSLTVGGQGPVLLEDLHFLDKMASFDRERIPERVVHAKGAGAFGYFETYQSMKKFTSADFLSSAGKRTKVFTRFSTVIGSKGSADTARDPRGFAVKFYTEDGVYDIVGNNIPVFFIRDAIKFPDVIHSLKPAPNDNIRNPERFWDFISLTPEATHMITWVYSDRGTIKSYRKMDGFGVNTYVWVNDEGERLFVKYHWKSLQGIETIDRFEAEYLAGVDPDCATRDLYEAIECGDGPKYELCVQMMEPEMADGLPFDPLDDTKTWPEELFPLYKVGIMHLNENPENFFAQVEQVAYCPSNLVPGIELSADKMLQGRAFSYMDTQRYRLGTNFMQLPINASKSPVNNNQRDGAMTYVYNAEPINYSPNRLNNNCPTSGQENLIVGPYLEGEKQRSRIEVTNDFYQAGDRYESLSEEEKANLVDNIAIELYKVRVDIRERVLRYFYEACPEFGGWVYSGIEYYLEANKE